MKEILDKLLALSTENEIVEFKKAKAQFDKDKMRQYFSALSNEANLKGITCAWIVFGVKNDKSIVGTTINDTQLNEYKNELAQHTSPRLSFELAERVERDGKQVNFVKYRLHLKDKPFHGRVITTAEMAKAWVHCTIMSEIE